MPVSKKPEGEWQDTSGDIWRPEKSGDFIQGVLLNKRPGRYQWNNYSIETDGGVRTVFGSAVLENRMGAIKEGDEVKIIFGGFEKNTKGQNMRMYTVQMRKK